MKQQPLNLNDPHDTHFLYRNMKRQGEPSVDHFANAKRIAAKINRRNMWKLSTEIVQEIQAGLKAALKREGFA